MKKLAIIGASYLQEPLIDKAKGMGIETHVFAWQSGDVGEKSADFFYPISIVEKEIILQKCKEIGIDGICSIASDLATVTVNFVANAMHLVGNTEQCVLLSTNKSKMRQAFASNGDPSPKSITVECIEDLKYVKLHYPVIVKPADRSGSRGITKLLSGDGLEAAIDYAKQQGFIKNALVEEYVEGREYSVECISRNKEHYFLTTTLKYTTNEPHFIETAHLEPSLLSEAMQKKVQRVVFHALDSLQIQNGASHSELKIDAEGNIKLIEIGARMGGDCIGSHLVRLSTGIDYIKAVIQIAMGEEPELVFADKVQAAAVRYIFCKEDLDIYYKLQKEHPEYIILSQLSKPTDAEVTDSATRFGFFVISALSYDKLIPYLPMESKSDVYH